MLTSTVDNKGQYQQRLGRGETENMGKEIFDTHLLIWPPELLQRMNVSMSRLLADKSMSRYKDSPWYLGEDMYRESMHHSMHGKWMVEHEDMHLLPLPSLVQ